VFLIELTPASLTYLTKLMDAPSVSVKSDDVMTHAQVRQQLAQPAESAKLMEQWKQEGAKAAFQAPPPAAPAAVEAPAAAPAAQAGPQLP